MTRRRELRRALGLGLCAAALLAAGCGAGDGGAALPRLPVPSPRETPAQALADLRAISASGQCTRLARRWHSSNIGLSRRLCLTILFRLDGLQDVFVVPHHTGFAASFARPGGGRRSAVMALDTDGRWRLLMVVDVDKGPVPAPAFVDRTARATLSAVRRLDCTQILRLVNRHVGMASSKDPQTACEDVADSDFAQALGVHPDAPLRRLGGGRNFTFYALDLGEDGYFTVLFGRDPVGPAPGRPVVQRLVAAIRSR